MEGGRRPTGRHKIGNWILHTCSFLFPKRIGSNISESIELIKVGLVLLDSCSNDWACIRSMIGFFLLV